MLESAETWTLASTVILDQLQQQESGGPWFEEGPPPFCACPRDDDADDGLLSKFPLPMFC